MVSAPGSSALAPPGGPLSTFLSVDGGRSWISSSGTSRGPPSMFLSVDGGRSRIFSSGTSWIPDGDRWWPLSEIPATPLKGPAIDFFNFSGGCCRTCRQHPPWGLPSTSSTSVVAAAEPAASTPQGAHRHLPSEKLKITERGAEELAPPVGSQPLPRWARGPLSAP
jgi:hypothetical protein